MRIRHIVLGLAALLITVGILGAPRTVRAAPSSSPVQATAAAPVTPRESKKIVLGETSIDGPAFWTNIPTGGPGAGAAALIAWTGTDPAHHLNTIAVGLDGKFSNKQTLNETSIARPAVTSLATQSPPNPTYLAWTGTDSGHTLNVICDNCAANRIKVTLWGESSFTGPAITLGNLGLMLAWTGTDAHHSLNIVPIKVENGQFAVGQKVTLTQFSSGAGPGLVYDYNTSQLLLSWTAPVTNRIDFAVSGDGVHWQRPLPAPLPELTSASPNMLAMVPLMSDMPHHFLAWTGTDAAHSVNVQYTNEYPQWPDPSETKLTMRETAIGGPALGVGTGVSGPNQIAVVWTGTDSAHHLNYATIDV